MWLFCILPCCPAFQVFAQVLHDVFEMFPVARVITDITFIFTLLLLLLQSILRMNWSHHVRAAWKK